jgi:hypothetical protein
MIAPEKVHMLRCVSSVDVAAYAKNTPHFSGLACLASGACVPFRVFSDVIKQPRNDLDAGRVVKYIDRKR